LAASLSLSLLSSSLKELTPAKHVAKDRARKEPNESQKALPMWPVQRPPVSLDMLERVLRTKPRLIQKAMNSKNAARRTKMNRSWGRQRRGRVRGIEEDV
jgi:hypothetical protein